MGGQRARPAGRARRADGPLATRIAELERALAARQPSLSASDSETLLRHLPDAVLVYCEDQVVFANMAAARLLGAADPSELIGRDSFSFVPPELRDEVKTRVREIAAGKAPSMVMRQVRLRLDGAGVPVESLAVPLEWHGRRAFLAIYRDLTEERRADMALRDSETRYRRLVELLPDAVSIQCEGKIVYVNAAAVRVFGAEREEQIIGRNFLDFCHPDDRELIHERIANLKEFGEATDFAERRRLRQDGTEFPAETAAQKLVWQGKPAVLVVVRDLTDRKRVQQALAAKTALLQATVESINEGLWAFDADLNLVIWNRRAVELLGFPHGMFRVGAPFASFILYAARRGDYGPGDPEELLASRIEIARKGSFVSFERRAANGRIIETRVNPMPGGGMVATFADITERKNAETAREALNRQLAEQAAELKRSNEELEQFAYIASHDLQEPLRMVSSYCQLLERRYKEKLDGDAREFIGYAVDGARRMQTLINDLLAYSRVGRRGEPFRPVELQKAIDIAISNLRRIIAEANVQIAAGPMPRVQGDETQLAQLFQNLIENAIKFSREEPVRIAIRAAPAAEGFEIAVADNGIGMEPQYAERIFLMFQRLHDRSKYPGNGIGLAICKKIVERHGGRIWVESEPGRGSTFKFTLSRG